MKLISKDNIHEFLTKYNNLHDANYENINYDVKNFSIKATFNGYDYGGEKPQRVQLSMLFNGVKSFEINEVFDWNFLLGASVEAKDDMWVYIDNPENPYVSILCKEIYFE